MKEHLERKGNVHQEVKIKFSFEFLGLFLLTFFFGGEGHKNLILLFYLDELVLKHCLFQEKTTIHNCDI